MEILLPIHILAGIFALLGAALSVLSEKGKNFTSFQVRRISGAWLLFFLQLFQCRLSAEISFCLL